jgi:transcriptional regulator with XRE-family HTH domain
LSSKNKNIFSVGSNLKILRHYKGLTLGQFASQININYETLKSYESNYINPSLLNLIKIADFLNISIDFLILGELTAFPRNLELITLAKEADSINQSGRDHISLSAVAFLQTRDSITDIKYDNIELTGDIHRNIKFLRGLRDITQKQLSEFLEGAPYQISFYEKSSIPPIDRLIKLSRFFNVSIHSLTTGKMLNFEFKDRKFGDVILKADRCLTLEQHKILITLMEAVLKNS